MFIFRETIQDQGKLALKHKRGRSIIAKIRLQMTEVRLFTEGAMLRYYCYIFMMWYMPIEGESLCSRLGSWCLGHR